MKWLTTAELERHGAVVSMLCPDPNCRAAVARVGFPEITIQSPLVKGGEIASVECVAGHRSPVAPGSVE